MQPILRIDKPRREGRERPNLVDYEEARRTFSWADARAELAGLPGGRGLNIGYECADRHVAEGRGEMVAIRWLSRAGAQRDISYAELSRRSGRFAALAASLGVRVGDRVAALLPRVPDLYVAALGTLKRKAVFMPIFSAFGPEPIRTRLAIAGASVLVTTRKLYVTKVAQLRWQLPELRSVLLVDGDPAHPVDDTITLRTALEGVHVDWSIPDTSEGDGALLHFTSGTTGTPKGAAHVHAAVIMHRATGRLVLDLKPGDVFWCTADPGWVTGTSYGIIAPLANGITLLVDEAEFDAERWYDILEHHHVDVWYTAPTAIRMLRRVGLGPLEGRRFPRLRFMASVGEPLDAASVVWGVAAFGMPFHDNWWQTETGGIAIANYASMTVKPGSMGRPLPGIEAAIVRRAGGRIEVITEPNVQGELALRPGWPSMFRAYWDAPERYAKCFADGWYLSGDLARKDADGYFWFVGRSDDVIKTAGHLIGPFEVESVLLAHPAVAEAGVIGKPDPVAGEIVKAFVSLKLGYEPSRELELELIAHARSRLGAAVAPRELAFLPNLPRTRSGKILRRLLRAQELGLPSGDLSSLETPPPP